MVTVPVTPRSLLSMFWWLLTNKEPAMNRDEEQLHEKATKLAYRTDEMTVAAQHLKAALSALRACGEGALAGRVEVLLIDVHNERRKERAP